MTIDIHELAKERFNVSKCDHALDEPGWNGETIALSSYIKAPITVREGYADLDSKIWLIAAPGAVGKSALATQLSHDIHAIYLDLAKAPTIGGNYISGGLMKNDLYDRWTNGDVVLSIDALDEARTRVTTDSFFDFLNDLVDMIHKKPNQVLIFGRSNVIDEAVLCFDAGKSFLPAVFDIGYFDEQQANKFIVADILRRLEQDNNSAKYESFKSHMKPLNECVEQIIHSLDTMTSDDNGNFSGYAPVLQAVSTFISQKDNIATIKTDVEQLLGNHILERICRSILRREQQKLQDQLKDSISNPILNSLYGIDEQLKRLCAKYFKKSVTIPNSLKTTEATQYNQAVDILFNDHPFFSENMKPANAVFEAAIQAYGLSNNLCNATDLPPQANPLFSEFYFYDSFIIQDKGEKKSDISPNAVVPIFMSLTARSPQGVKIGLNIEEGDEQEDDNNSKTVEVTISKYISTKSPNSTDEEPFFDEIETELEVFKIPANSTLVFQNNLSSVNILAPDLTVEIGSGTEISITSPVDIDVKRLDFLGTKLCVFPGTDRDKIVRFEAAEEPSSGFVEKIILYPPGSNATVKWPGSAAYPWSEFLQIEDAQVTDSSRRMQTALAAYCRLIRAFRSHSKGALARCAGKIEHARMSKNSGEEIRNQLLLDNVLTKSGNMYYLDATRLDKLTGMTYLKVVKKEYGEQLINYISKIL